MCANDNRKGMVYFFFLADTLARKFEKKNSGEWTEETAEKCGVARGSFFVVYGPIRKAEQFDAHIKACICDMDHYIDNSLKSDCGHLPGRSITVIHERNTSLFEKLYDRPAEFILPTGGRVEIEKNPVTGVYQIDIFA